MQCAWNNYEASLAIFQDLGNKTGEANSLGRIGHIEDNQEKALEYLFQSLQLFEDLKVVPKMLTILVYTSSLYYKKGDFDKVLFYFKKMLTVVEQTGRKEAKTKVVSQLILELEEKQEWDSLNNFYSVALESSIEDRMSY